MGDSQRIIVSANESTQRLAAVVVGLEEVSRYQTRLRVGGSNLLSLGCQFRYGPGEMLMVVLTPAAIIEIQNGVVGPLVSRLGIQWHGLVEPVGVDRPTEEAYLTWDQLAGVLTNQHAASTSGGARVVMYNPSIQRGAQWEGVDVEVDPAGRTVTFHVPSLIVEALLRAWQVEARSVYGAFTS